MTAVPSTGDPWAVIERAERLEAAGDPVGAVTLLEAACREHPERTMLRRLVRLRRSAFFAMSRVNGNARELARVAVPPLSPATGLAVAEPGALSPALVKGAIETHGSLMVRGLLPPAQVSRLMSAVDSALAARHSQQSGASLDETGAWYDELEDVPHGGGRSFMQAGGVLAGDSPRGMFELLEVFREAGIDTLASEVLGEHASVAFEKTVLRRVAPAPHATSWHQDGAFLGEAVRSLNVWVALSRCGRDAPGLELVPRRADHVVETGAYFTWDIAEATIEKTFPGVRAAAPEFLPGDVVFFDHLCMHRTYQLPGMTLPRYAIESWFFAPSAYPPSTTGMYV